jgi:YVTN family beta-propeller protein
LRLLVITALAVASVSFAQPLRLQKSIPLALPEGRLGQLAWDGKEQRLFVPIAAAGTVEVVDIKAGRRLRSIGGFRSPVAVAFAPTLNRVFVSNREDGTVSIIDGKTYAVLSRVVWPGNPTLLRIDPAGKNVFVAYGISVGMMDIGGRRIGTIRLDAAAESFHVASSGPHVWINVPSARSVAFADRARAAVRQMWPVGTAGSGGPNFGMAIDEKNRRMFVACRRPATLVTLHLDTGYRIDTRATVNNADEVHYDAVNGRLYVPGGDGQVDVVRQVSPDKYEPLARIDSAPGARTAWLASEHALFLLAVPKRGSQPAEVRVYAIGK